MEKIKAYFQQFGFVKAEKIYKRIQIIGYIFVFLLLLFRGTNNTMMWVCCGVVILTCIPSFMLTWYNMRCPWCDHTISAYRAYKSDCPSCGKPITIGPDGRLSQTGTPLSVFTGSKKKK